MFGCIDLPRDLTTECAARVLVRLALGNKINTLEARTYNGLWRSLVAHLTGGQGVVGSNPASPTIKYQVSDVSVDLGLHLDGRGSLAGSQRLPWTPSDRRVHRWLETPCAEHLLEGDLG
jgi:hypothetical protein